jgi:hypothetical protein
MLQTRIVKHTSALFTNIADASSQQGSVGENASVILRLTTDVSTEDISLINHPITRGTCHTTRVFDLLFIYRRVLTNVSLIIYRRMSETHACSNE